MILNVFNHLFTKQPIINEDQYHWYNTATDVSIKCISP